MDSRSQLTVDVIAKVTQGRISIHSASKLLNKSRRTIERYLHRYRLVKAYALLSMAIKVVSLSIKPLIH
jgi:transposase